MENAPLTTPECPKTPEQIQDEMSRTRESLTEKVAALENHVVGGVQTAADALSGTVDSVKSLVNSAPAAVADTVKQATAAMKKTFDVSAQVRENPWSAVGISAGIGFVAGWLLTGRASAAAPVAVAAPAAASALAPTRPGLLDELVAMLGRKVREVAETAIESASTAVNNSVRSEVPKLVDAAAAVATERLVPESPYPDRFNRLGGFPG